MRIGKSLAWVLFQTSALPAEEGNKGMSRSEFEWRLRWFCMNRSLYCW